MNQPCSPSSAVVSFQSNKTWLNLSLAFLHGYLIFCRKIDFPFSGFCSALLISLFLPIHWKAETSANTPSPFKNLWDSILCHANAHSSLELQKSSPICRAVSRNQNYKFLTFWLANCHTRVIQVNKTTLVQNNAINRHLGYNFDMRVVKSKLQLAIRLRILV